MDWRGKGFVCGIVIAVLTTITVQHRRIERLTAERDRYKGNAETLFSDVETYKVRDSLNAARVQGLELTVKEYQKFRAEDAALVKELTIKNRDLSAINKTQAETIIELRAAAKDTVIIRDSVPVPAMALHCGDAWFDFDGLLADGEFTGTLSNRDSLVLAESVRYKRFWGFLWKTKKVADRQLDCVSKNPHTRIIGIEHIVIEK